MTLTQAGPHRKGLGDKAPFGWYSITAKQRQTITQNNVDASASAIVQPVVLQLNLLNQLVSVNGSSDVIQTPGRQDMQAYRQVTLVEASKIQV